MAMPVLTIVRKLFPLLTSKRFWKIVGGIVVGIVIIIIMPILAVLAIFPNAITLNTQPLEPFISEYERTAKEKATEIEEQMTARGFTVLQIEEAQVLYMVALYDYGEQEGFVDKLIGCYTLDKQTDEELITRVNEAFGTSYTAEEYTSLVQELRDRQV